MIIWEVESTYVFFFPLKFRWVKNKKEEREKKDALLINYSVVLLLKSGEIINVWRVKMKHGKK